jgi:putative SOS response-associated peptidase YedK
MCGRYALITPIQELEAAVGVVQTEIPTNQQLHLPTYNASPGQTLPVIIEHKWRQLRGMRWGLVPNWAPTAVSKGNTINAQQETLTTKPSFRHLVQTNRCVVPVSAFYEWQPLGNLKQPYAIMPMEGIAYLAGLWDRWISPLDSSIIETFTIITTPSAGLMTNLHDRQPVVLAPKDLEQWLDGKSLWPDLAPMLQSYAWLNWKSYPVSSMVNNVKHNSPQLLAEAPRIATQGSLFG